jgi:hypothetical protein
MALLTFVVLLPRGMAVQHQGEARWFGDRWLITYDTLGSLLSRAGVTLPPRPPSDRRDDDG